MIRSAIAPHDGTPWILAHHIGGLGDTVITIPAMRAIRAHWPGHKLALLCNVSTHGVSARDVLAGDVLVDEFIEYARHGSAAALALELFDTVRRLRRRRFAAVVALGPSDRAAAGVQRDGWFFRRCGITTMVGFRSPADEATSTWPVAEWARKLWRLSLDGVTASPTAGSQLPLLTLHADEVAHGSAVANHARPGRPLVAMGIAGMWASKGWPAERFATIGRRLDASGFDIVIVGGTPEMAQAQALIDQWGFGVNACGLAVRPTAGLLTLCRAFIGVDSGPAHLAAAMGVRVVVVSWAGMPDGLWHPVGTGHRVLRLPVPCAGCRHRVCPVAGHPCVSGLQVQDAWQALAAVL